ncbi:unnamed protein product [Lathyrus oleraceus]|uniref:Uncharacterized protein n=1 Tax=Pisum sativum TaxID=3888 RepID=A0A9D5BGY2_PEA|nr:uncharacterized protein At3g27210-like isoform X2 [Pisum sativum]KAI5443455.1 hypothetical protein KIW84_012195 [Pisum sativum]
MGSCSSIQRKPNTDNNNMKVKVSFFGSKTEKLVVPSSPIKEQTKNGDFMLSPSKSTTNFINYGSKEEAFFDSKPWMDSDCEDDFYSVNGDFTPSRGNTPIHHAFATLDVNKTLSQNRVSPSPSESSPEKKKKLLELFKDSVKDNQGDDSKEKRQVKSTIQDVLPKSSQSTPYCSRANSASSSERITSDDRVSGKEKSHKSSLFCIPSLTSCRSSRERRRKTSPAIAVEGKQ